jgi:hypothetical protein
MTMDLLDLAIVKCQLGLFGYKPEKKVVSPARHVTRELEEALVGDLIEEKLPCAAAWRIAEVLGLKKMEVSSACETLGFKISPCQLGAF